jgi:enoyl-CoA hydratase/carnithine racemase
VSDLQVAELDEPAADGPRPLSLRLAAPRRRNALTLETVTHLLTVLGETREQVVLLGSSTPGVFSAGADLTADDATRAVLSDRHYACYEEIITRPGIVVAVVDGAAVGGGAQLSAASDLRVVSPAARWRWVGPGHGLAVGAWILPDLLGRGRALDLTLTGRWLDADEATVAGFTSRVADDPWRAAREVVETLVRADAAALARVKQVATSPTLPQRLREERTRNREAWDGQAPLPADAAADGRRSGRA